MKAARRPAALLLALLLTLTAACAPAPAVTRGFAMDTEVTLTLYGGESDLGAALLREIARVENELSWNAREGAVATLNETGRAESALLARTVADLLPLCRVSEGEYSLLMRPLCALWNVTGEAPRVPDPAEIDALLPLCRGRVEVSGDVVTLPDGGQMDLGSAGKGVACDVAYAFLAEKGVAGVIACGGSVVACGSKPGGSLWQISVAAPDERNRSVGTLSLPGGRFVSTSGSGERYFEENGVRYHHILSGVTGRPADAGLASVTVVCGSGVLADALSTVCFLLGREKSLPILAHYGADAIFQGSDGSLYATDGLKSAFEAAP